MPKATLKVFVSHSWHRDNMLHKTITGSLRTGGFEVEDLSLRENDRIKGPRGGRVVEIVVKREIADRIGRSDIVIAPAEKMSEGAEWVGWELDCAAQSNKPILFLSHMENRRQYNGKLSEFEQAGLKVRRSTADPEAILEAVKAMLPHRRN